MQRKFLLLIVFMGSAICLGKSKVQSNRKLEPSAPCTTEDPTKGTTLLETKKWQEQLVDLLCKDSSAVEAWGLFDQGGFAGVGDFGQVLVLGRSKEIKVLFIPVRGEKFKTEQIIKDAKGTKFQSEVKALSSVQEFKDHWDNGLDMIEKEFIHVEKKGHSLKLTQRVKWRFGRGPCKVHCELAHAFQALVK